MNPERWTYEHGFVRNRELQWYQPENALCRNGLLVIEARRERVENPDYDPQSRDWRRRRSHAEYTSACVTTRGLSEWRYGRFEVRARIDTRPGLWPAFWTLGSARRWPGCGEIDIMEYYQGDLLANAAWLGSRRYEPRWNTSRRPIRTFADEDWSAKFHVWRLDWNEDFLRVFVDDEMLNEVPLADTFNNDEESANPFHEPHYILLNLAVGGTQGGDPSKTEFPAKFEVDYVRIYQEQ